MRALTSTQRASAGTAAAAADAAGSAARAAAASGSPPASAAAGPAAAAAAGSWPTLARSGRSAARSAASTCASARQASISRHRTCSCKGRPADGKAAAASPPGPELGHAPWSGSVAGSAPAPPGAASGGRAQPSAQESCCSADASCAWRGGRHAAPRRPFHSCAGRPSNVLRALLGGQETA